MWADAEINGHEKKWEEEAKRKRAEYAKKVEESNKLLEAPII